MVEEIKNGYVKWKIFIWTISIITLIIGGLFTMSGSALEKSNNNTNKLDTLVEREANHYNEIKEDLNEIKTDVKEILKQNK